MTKLVFTLNILETWWNTHNLLEHQRENNPQKINDQCRKNGYIGKQEIFQALVTIFETFQKLKVLPAYAPSSKVDFNVINIWRHIQHLHPLLKVIGDINNLKRRVYRYIHPVEGFGTMGLVIICKIDRQRIRFINFVKLNKNEEVSIAVEDYFEGIIKSAGEPNKRGIIEIKKQVHDGLHIDRKNDLRSQKVLSIMTPTLPSGVCNIISELAAD